MIVDEPLEQRVPDGRLVHMSAFVRAWSRDGPPSIR